MCWRAYRGPGAFGQDGMDSGTKIRLYDLMLLRFILPFFFALSLGGQALACSCGPWSGYVSEFTESYVSVWAVPTKATVNIQHVGKPSGGVTYNLDILEGFERIIKSEISVDSNVADGGSCGVQLTLGLPQFISAYKYDIDNYGISSCTPNLPYDALKLYLETGEDTYIPEWSECYSWPENGSNFSPVLNKNLEECTVWKEADHINSFPGSKDGGKYNKIWWNKIESINTEPKKKRSWWSFKKD